MKKRGAFFYILILLAFLTLGALIYFLAPGNAPETPAVLLPAMPTPVSGGEESDTGYVGGELITLDCDSVQTVIAMQKRVDSYSRSLTVQSFWSGGSSSSEISTWVRGGDTRVSIRRGGDETVKNILLLDDRKWIWYSDAAGVYQGPARDGDADAYQTLLTYEDVLDLPREAILDAGFLPYEGESCVFVDYESGQFGYRNRCYISADTGLMMGQETYDGDVLIYLMTSSRPDLSMPADELFAPP